MNLLEETIKKMETKNKKESDVLWVGTEGLKITWENFEEIADVEYDSGFGSAEVAKDLIIVGKNWWLERHEYDGSEWWEYKSIPKEPTKKIVIKALTIDQSEKLGISISCGWENLERINGIKED